MRDNLVTRYPVTMAEVAKQIKLDERCHRKVVDAADKFLRDHRLTARQRALLDDEEGADPLVAVTERTKD